MEHEATLRFVTNLDRTGIEAQLRQVQEKAEARELKELAALLASAPGQSREGLENLIQRGIEMVRVSNGPKGLADQLEIVLLNLPNLG